MNKYIIVKLKGLKDVALHIEIIAPAEIEEEWIIAELRSDGVYYEIESDTELQRIAKKFKKDYSSR